MTFMDNVSSSNEEEKTDILLTHPYLWQQKIRLTSSLFANRRLISNVLIRPRNRDIQQSRDKGAQGSSDAESSAHLYRTGVETNGHIRVVNPYTRRPCTYSPHRLMRTHVCYMYVCKYIYTYYTDGYTMDLGNC